MKSGMNDIQSLKAQLLSQLDEMRAAIVQLADDAELGSHMRTTFHGRGTGKKRGRRPGSSSEKLSSETLMAALKAGGGEGLSLGDLATQMGGPRNKSRIATALRQLRDLKQVRLVGEKRHARWFA